MRVGVLKIDLHISSAGSLKDKRQILRSLKDRLMARFNVSVAEVGAQDLWQRAEIGIARVSLDAKGADSALRKVEEFVRQHAGVSIIEVSRAIEAFEDDEADYGNLDWEDDSGEESSSEPFPFGR